MWDEILDPVPEAPWREHLAHIAAWLEGFGGRALIEPPRIEWHAPSTFASILAVDDPAVDTADAASDDTAHVDEEHGNEEHGDDERIEEVRAAAPEEASGGDGRSADESRDTDRGADEPATASADTDSVAETGPAGTALATDSATAQDPATAGQSANAESATGESDSAVSPGRGSPDAVPGDDDSASGDADVDGEVTVAIKTAKTDDHGTPAVRIPTQQQRARGGRAASPSRSVASATRDLPKRVADDDPNFDLASDPR
jgi:hypothetical protein